MPDILYRVMMRDADTGEWEIWTNYHALDDAIMAANGLVLSRTANVSEVEIVEVRAGGEGTPVATVSLDNNKRPQVRRLRRRNE